MTDTPRNTPVNPELERLKIEHKIDLENKEIESEWKSCCFTTDKIWFCILGKYRSHLPFWHLVLLC